MIDKTARNAWRELEQKIRPFIARRVRRSCDVDDVLQDVLLRMQQGLDGLRDDERFGPWVYRVARSAIVDFQRKLSRYEVTREASSCEVQLNADDAGESVVEPEVATYIAPFVAMLPSPYREALTLTELEGQTQKVAAAMLGVSVSGMKSRVQRGRLLLRASFEACCQIALDARGHVMECTPRVDGDLPNGCPSNDCCASQQSLPSISKVP